MFGICGLVVTSNYSHCGHLSLLISSKQRLIYLQALKLLKRIPEESIGKLGMNSIVARPEALIMQCVPVPPNCTRTTDYKYVNNTSFVRFGTVRCQSCPCSMSMSRLLYVWPLELKNLCKFCASTNFGRSYVCIASPSLCNCHR